MAHVQYQTTVPWDLTLKDVGFLDDSTGSLVISAVKTTSGAPAATAGYFAPGAIINNISTGVLYVNSGSTSSPTWSIIDASTGGLPPLTDGEIWVGNASDVATEVALSGDVTMDNTGVTTVGAIDLETATVTNIADTEIMIGTGAGTAAFAPLSGDATMDNTGAVEISDLTIASEAAGDILYFNGTNWVKLAIGTAGQVLTVNAGATAPEWQTP